MPRPLAPAVRDRIVELVHEGQSCRDIARVVGCGIATVSRIAAAAGAEFVGAERSNPKNLATARRDYAQAERLALLNAGFDKAASMLDDLTTPSHLQTWTVAVAVLIDKRRLEDGEATARTETHDSGAPRERIASRLDELAARRDAHRAAG